MNVHVTFKDPDGLHESIKSALKKQIKPAGMTAKEWESILESREERLRELISDAYVEYGEYLEVEFEVDDETEKVTARLVPRRE